MGMIVGIYKDARLGDCTNGGISAKATGLTVVNVDGPFEPSDLYPAAMLVDSPFGGAILVPATRDAGHWEPVASGNRCGPMFGGNIADTSDSRWCDAVRSHVTGTLRKAGITDRIQSMAFSTSVRIHDRFESWEQYEAMTRG